MNTYNFKLELNKGPHFATGSGFKEVTIRKGDLNGTTIVAEIYDHGTKLTTANLSAVFEMLQPDRTHYYRETATYSNGTVSITLDESFAASVAGTTDLAYFRLYQGSQVIASTESFRVTILRSAEDEGDDPAISYDDAVPAAVDAWLEDHPEATTTVQDNSLTTTKYQDGSVTTPKLATDSVTTPKLADNSVTDAKLSTTGVLAKVNRLLGNVLRGTGSGAVVTAHDAYAAPPLGLTVDGKSVQDGTPAPSAPVAIDSVDSVAVALGEPHAVPTDEIESGEIAGNGTESANTKCCRTKSTAIYAPNGHAGIVVTGNTSASGVIQYAVNCKMQDGTYQNAVNAWTQVGEPIAFPSGAVSFRFCFKTTMGATISPSSLSDIAYTLFDATTIDLQGHELRSLPDGTHDELVVDADGNVTLVQRVGAKAMTVSVQYSNRTIDGVTYYTYGNNTFTDRRVETAVNASTYVSNCFGSSSTSAQNTDAPNKISFNKNTSSKYMYVQTNVADTIDGINSWLTEHGAVVHYALATPVTIPLGTVTLPALPAPDMTAWAQTTPATTIALDYERDLTIAIDNLEAAIADLATS